MKADKSGRAPGMTMFNINANLDAIKLFTVAIFGLFSAHFQLHFWIIFGCLAEE